MSRLRFDYIPHVDGLRAVAIIAVVLYHFDIWPFTGGYVGVDIFFVISGFLITRFIIHDMETGEFSYSRFYMRRARRLFPAYFVTLLSTYLFGLISFAPEHLELLVKSLISAVIAVPNFYFWSVSGYFDLASEFKPLLHTWSLGVEEQFYFLWPAVLVGMLRFGGKKWAIAALGITAAGSLLAAQSFLSRDADAVFYLVQFRMFEFAIGAVLVWLPPIQFRHNLWTEVCFASGLILMGGSILLYSDSTAFPGLSALPCCIGAALAIHSGRARVTGRLLNNRLAVGIGLISYSLYLVHWPLFVFYKYWTLTPLTYLEKIALILGAFFLAIIMYRYVEMPFRRSHGFSNSAFLGAATSSAILLLFACALTLTFAGEFRLTDSAKVTAQLLRSFKLSPHCNSIQISDSHTICKFGAKGTRTADVLVFGDSHGEMLTAGLAPYLTDRNKSAILITAGGILPFYSTTTIDKDGPSQFRFRSPMEEYTTDNVKLVIIHGRFSLYWHGMPEKLGPLSLPRHPWLIQSPSFKDLTKESSHKAFLEGLDDTLAFFKIKEKKVLLIGAVPEIGQDLGKCFARDVLISEENCPRLTAAESLQWAEEVNLAMASVAKKYGNVRFFDPGPTICRQISHAYCDLFSQGKILYRDDHHISEYGSYILIRRLKKYLDTVLQ